MGIEILKTNGENNDFMHLIGLLDNDLAKRYGELQKKYNTHNNVELINDVIVIYKDKFPVACGGIKKFDSKTVELKRMFVLPQNRQQGFAKLIISELEKLASSMGYEYMILETGKKQVEAINLYSSYGFTLTANYGPYAGNENSICMKKDMGENR